jgi:hypothetical protein
MVDPHYVCIDAISDYPTDWMTYCRCCSQMADRHHVCADVSSEYLALWTTYCSCCTEVAVSYYVCVDVSSEATVEEWFNTHIAYTIQAYKIYIYTYIYGPQSQLTISLFFKSSLHVSVPTGHLQVKTYQHQISYSCEEPSHYKNTSIISMTMSLIYYFLNYL